MAFVIAEPCLGCRDGACRTACPCDCIQEGTVTVEGRSYLQMFIDPLECIDCGMCESECPVDAIFPGDELPDAWRHYAGINATFSKTR